MSSTGSTSSFDDEESIPDEEFVYRRILFPNWVDDTKRDNLGRPRIKRSAFQEFGAEKARQLGYPGPCFSVGLSSVLTAHGREPTDLLEGWDSEDRKYGIAHLRVADIRRKGRGVMARPTDQEPWHAVVFPKTTETRKQKADSESALAAAAVWVHVPTSGP